MSISGPWRIEEGEKTGLHLHVLLSYTARSREHIYIAKLIGEDWATVVTDGKGAHWNSNADKTRQAKYGHGIGMDMIDRTDEPKREALRENIRYLTKADQYLTMKYGEQVPHCDEPGGSAKGRSGRTRQEVGVRSGRCVRPNPPAELTRWQSQGEVTSGE